MSSDIQVHFSQRVLSRNADQHWKLPSEILTSRKHVRKFDKSSTNSSKRKRKKGSRMKDLLHANITIKETATGRRLIIQGAKCPGASDI